jgi:hypothetical protein
MSRQMNQPDETTNITNVLMMKEIILVIVGEKYFLKQSDLLFI